MRRFRLSRLAEADLLAILATSRSQWGSAGERGYAALIAAAIRKVAVEPAGPATRQREELRPGIRSFHLRHARSADPEARVRRPAHVLYYRSVSPDVIEIVRVLHERIEPRRHLFELLEDQ
ncbi:MAG: type II toxin-antitoxin system RelE/ParE family toxin [Alphaproteobacteria bacterium]|nr:type II toxin-antitoxin system RelE/ParE family toxin [Alphaproteobacteria bacterium]